MKKLLLIIAIAFAGLPAVTAQNVYVGDVLFDSQISIDGFIILYPNCTKIDGNVTIEGAGINNFYGLQHIDTITGSLNIQNNPELTILSWLDNLKYIGGNLEIKNNAKLVSFEGLCGLQMISGDFEINGNDALTGIKGAGTKPALGMLTEVVGMLLINNNISLTSLSGFDALTNVGKLGIVYNSKLNDFTGLGALKTIGNVYDAYFYVGYNSITSFSGLDALTNITGYLYVEHNSLLRSLSGLEPLSSLGGYLKIADNAVLNDISGISNIDPATIDDPVAGNTDLFITNNPQLSLCSVSNICELVSNKIVEIHNNFYGCNSGAEISTGCATTYTGDLVFTSQAEIDAFYVYFQNCTKIDGSVTVEETTQDDIWNFAGLSRITEITGDLIIKNNHKLPFFSWLENLTAIGGGLIVQNNASLVSFQGLSGLQTVDSIVVDFNPGLINFAGTEPGHEGLSSLTTVRGKFDFWNNNEMISFEGLCELETIGEGFLIYENDKLTEFKGADTQNPALGKLTSVGDDLWIYNNAGLKFLNGLDNVNYVGGNLIISSNPELQSLEGLDNVTSVRGNLDVAGNSILPSIDGLNKITSVGGDLYIMYNDKLKTLAGLENIESIGGSIKVYENAELTTLTGLDKTTSVSADLLIYNNAELNSIEGLKNILSVGGSLDIESNSKLVSLAGLDNIKSLGEYLYIANNDVLNDISGIRNIDPATIKSTDQTWYKDLNIFNNPQLSECAMDLCQFVTYPGLTTDIHDNGNLCSDADITESCTPPACTHLTDPVNGAVDVKVNSNISWAAVTGAAGYWLQVGTTSGGTEILDDNVQQVTTWDPQVDFEGGATIYVTVMPYNEFGLLANCSEESFTVEAIATGVSNTEDGSGIKLYPNPARNTLYLRYDKDAFFNRGNIRIEIYSATGQKVKVTDHITDKIDISGLSKGIYLINFITDKGTVTMKFVVAR